VDVEESAGIGQGAQRQRRPGETPDQPGGLKHHPEDLPLGLAAVADLVRRAEHPRQLEAARAEQRKPDPKGGG